jgi:hypothetical protein
VSVALIATLLSGLVFAGAALFLNAFVAHRLVDEVDRQLADRLSRARREPPSLATTRPTSSSGSGHFGLGIYGEPIYVWQVLPGGSIADPAAD